MSRAKFNFENPNAVLVAFPLPVVEGKDLKKKCCKKFKKGKRCKRCPGNKKK